MSDYDEADNGDDSTVTVHRQCGRVVVDLALHAAECRSVHLHTFSVVDPDDSYKRLCRDCGEPQVYRPPTGGQRFEFDDVMVSKEDLRLLLSIAVYPEYDPLGEYDKMGERLELLLA